MAQEVYKNDDGQVLFGNSGNVFRRPYNFGNSFVNKMGLNNYIQVSGISANYYDVEFIVRGSRPSGISTTQRLFTAYNDSFDYISYRFTGATANATIVTSTGSLSVGQLLSGGKLSDSHISFGEGIGYFMKSQINTVSIADTSSVSISSIVDKLKIGSTYQGGEYLHQDYKINRVSIFNRQHSTEERLYYYNQASGSDFLTPNKIVLDINFQNGAEILDFSVAQDGSDMRVGVRDYSGSNYHGEIINLPAGTLQEQLDYANANLFVPFID